MNWIEDQNNSPLEFIERCNIRGGIRGYTDRLDKYPNVIFQISPLTIQTTLLSNWRLEFKQKTSQSRMYLHFHNKKNFGFRVQLNRQKYEDILDIFFSLGTPGTNPITFEPHLVFTSEHSVFIKAPEVSKPKVVHKTVYVDRPVPTEISFEEFHQKERERIFASIGDFRGVKNSKEIDYSNVIDFEEYLKEIQDIQPSDNLETLIKSLG